MDLSLFHLFLYATIALSVLTLAGTAFYLRDRARRRADSPDQEADPTPADRLAEIEHQIAFLRQGIDRLEAERRALLNLPTDPQLPRSM